MYSDLIIYYDRKGVLMQFNNKNYKLSILLVVFNVLLIAITVMTSPINVGASDLSESKDQVDFKNAMDTAPRGLNIDDPAFKLGTFDGNNGEVLRRNDDPTDYSGVLQVTNNVDQISAIWSNFAANNYFDMDKPQTLSMWMYFGRPYPSKDSDNALQVGDGMAFVLQNDPREYGAISTYKNTPAVGETLGVWGADFNNLPDYYSGNFATSEDVAKTAIQNSWAMEFDTFVNRLSMYDQINGKGVSFDLNEQGQHMGNNYPGEAATYNPLYVKRINDSNKKKRYFTLDHRQGNQYMNLTDQNWHHITIKWDPTTHNLTYSLNDKNLDGSWSNVLGYKYTINLDIDKFHFKTADHRLHWGFTGTTGRFTENNFIVFESIPSFINAESHVSIENITSGKPVKENDTVDFGDKLDFIYKLNYVSGTKDWEKILANIDFPSEVSFDSGTIEYDDGTPSETIDLKEISHNNIQHMLKKSLNSTHANALIVLHTTADKAKRSTTVSAKHASFKSDNFIIDDNTPSFRIRTDSLMISTDPSGTINFPNKDTIPDNILIDGSIWYGNGVPIKPSNITVYSKLNDSPSESMKLTKNKDYLTASFLLNIPKSQLHIGTNNLKIYAVSSVALNSVSAPVVLTSREVNISINVDGGLRFGEVSDNVSFQPVNSGYTGEMVPRQDGWHVQVIDGRASGNSWTLQARAHDLINQSGQVLNGNIVYKNVMGKLMPLADLTNIYTNTKDSDASQQIDITESWTDKLGMFLKLTSDSSAGKYSGKIDWVLNDGLPNT